MAAKTSKKTTSKRSSAKKSSTKQTSSPQARRKVSSVMKEYKKGTLHTRSKNGPKVTSRKQAIAIALHEAGVSKKSSPSSKKGARRALKKVAKKSRVPSKKK